MSAVRTLLAASLALLAAAACSSTSPVQGGPDAGYCESNGYASPSGGSCPKGTCPASGTSVACCGSECATCEAKGLVSYGDGGQCPAGTCPSGDVTATLHCCDSCGPLGGTDAGGSDATPEASVVDGGAG
jgi:hypothetical protein